MAPNMVVSGAATCPRPKARNAFGRRRRSPQERFSSVGQARSEGLVARPLAGMGRRDMADVVEIQQRTPPRPA
jgi:hypothetical protein